MSKELPLDDQADSMSAVQNAIRYLERKVIRKGTSLWANVTVKFRGKQVHDDDRMVVHLHHDGGNRAGVALYWSESPNDDRDEVPAAMNAQGFHGLTGYRWQRIRFVKPNTLYIEDPKLRCVYDLTLTFEDVGAVRRGRSSEARPSCSTRPRAPWSPVA